MPSARRSSEPLTIATELLPFEKRHRWQLMDGKQYLHLCFVTPTTGMCALHIPSFLPSFALPFSSTSRHVSLQAVMAGLKAEREESGTSRTEGFNNLGQARSFASLVER